MLLAFWRPYHRSWVLVLVICFHKLLISHSCRESLRELRYTRRPSAYTSDQKPPTNRVHPPDRMSNRSPCLRHQVGPSAQPVRLRTVTRYYAAWQRPHHEWVRGAKAFTERLDDKRSPVLLRVLSIMVRYVLKDARDAVLVVTEALQVVEVLLGRRTEGRFQAPFAWTAAAALLLPRSREVRLPEETRPNHRRQQQLPPCTSIQTG